MRVPAFILALGLALALPSAPRAEVRIVGPEELRERLESRDGRVEVTLDGRRWELVTDPRDESLSKLGDGSFHPMDVDEIRAALRDLRGLHLLPDLTIYVLPYPRREVLESSCHGATIYLSPGLRDVPTAHVHWTVVHEVGHVVQHELAPRGSQRFDDFFSVRDLDPAHHHDGAKHADRPAEIFAEDFRVLRGGTIARDAGRIENRDLPDPDQVPGLPAWFDRLLRAPRHRSLEDAPASFPNPFRAGQGSLTIHFGAAAPQAVPGGTAVVHDVGGRRVATLWQPIAGSSGVTFQWNGRDDAGRAVASGIYLVRWEQRPDLGAARVQVVR